MIVVEMNGIEFPDGWEERAHNALTSASNEPDTARRKALIERNRAIWSDLKPALASLSHGKCWYCEARELRSHAAVDHFRPKGRVDECEDHDGYWWLAFDWRNFRFSCTYCNSPKKDSTTGHTGGKCDHFPLIDEDFRARGADDDIGREYPRLLDPTDPSDPGLLSFDLSGKCVPSVESDGDPVGYLRAAYSIGIYHLNHVDLREARQAISSRIIELVTRADRLFRRRFESDFDFKKSFGDVLSDIKKIVNSKAEFSAAARDVLYSCRAPDRFWLDQFLRTL